MLLAELWGDTKANYSLQSFFILVEIVKVKSGICSVTSSSYFNLCPLMSYFYCDVLPAWLSTKFPTESDSFLFFNNNVELRRMLMYFGNLAITVLAIIFIYYTAGFTCSPGILFFLYRRLRYYIWSSSVNDTQQPLMSVINPVDVNTWINRIIEEKKKRENIYICLIILVGSSFVSDCMHATFFYSQTFLSMSVIFYSSNISGYVFLTFR